MAIKTYPPNYNYGTGAAPYYATPHTAGIDSLPKASGIIHGPGYEATLREMSQRLARGMLRDQYRAERAKPLPGEKKSATMDEIKAAVKSGKRLYANIPSTCFDELSWHKGIAHAEFAYRNPDGGYDYECDLETFLEWCSDSLGEFFNAEIR
jgi:hypothetical protein